MKETSNHASVSDTGYGDHDFYLFHSDRRTDAIVLEALILDAPKDDVIPKLARGLLAARKQGRWMSTQENGYVLMALNRYFNKYEGTTPNFDAQEWIGDAFVGTQKFAGRSFNSQTVSIPMKWLSKQRKTEDVLINKVGAGRLYYRLALTYAPTNLQLKALDNGFSVTRKYEGVDRPGDATQDANGVWHIKAGSTIRVKVNFSATSPRYHVALADPLPAGVEPLNPELSGIRKTFAQPQTTLEPDSEEKSEGGEEDATLISDLGILLPPEALPPPPPLPYSPEPAAVEVILPFWTWPWFDHQNLRDHQAEAFASIISGGEYDYSYLAKATTPGVYNVAPTKAEEMYSPETFGRGSSDKVIVE
jgi:hypothetical protein